jgi:hypothetical protein
MRKNIFKDIEFRNRDKPLGIEEVTNRIGEAHLEKTMALLRWRQESNPSNRDKDHEGVDYTYSYGHARIQIQLKSKNFDLQHNNWSWHISDSYEDFKGFYDEIGTFLFLVGINIFLEKDIYREIKEGKFQYKKKRQLLERKHELPIVSLIPGEKIMKFFEKSKGLINLHISQRKLILEQYNQWNDYFGENKIQDKLRSEWECQEKEYKTQMENRSFHYKGSSATERQ